MMKMYLYGHKIDILIFKEEILGFLPPLSIQSRKPIACNYGI